MLSKNSFTDPWWLSFVITLEINKMFLKWNLDQNTLEIIIIIFWSSVILEKYEKMWNSVDIVTYCILKLNFSTMSLSKFVIYKAIKLLKFVSF